MPPSLCVNQGPAKDSISKRHSQERVIGQPEILPFTFGPSLQSRFLLISMEFRSQSKKQGMASGHSNQSAKGLGHFQNTEKPQEEMRPGWR